MEPMSLEMMRFRRLHFYSFALMGFSAEYIGNKSEKIDLDKFNMYLEGAMLPTVGPAQFEDIKNMARDALNLLYQNLHNIDQRRKAANG